MKSFAYDDLDNLLNGVLQSLYGDGGNKEEDPYKLLEEAPETMPKPTSSFGSQVLANAKADLGVREDLGRNDGKRIREYFKYFNMGAGQEWCAAAVSAWIKEAGGGPIAGGVGARNIAAQFAQIDKWIPKEKITSNAMTPGNIIVWSRGDSGSWKGHIGVLESFNGNDSFTSIEANSGPRSDSVVRNTHSINDSNLLGVGILSDYTPNKKHVSTSRQSIAKQIHVIEKMANTYYKKANIMINNFQKPVNSLKEQLNQISSCKNSDIGNMVWNFIGFGAGIRYVLESIGSKNTELFNSLHNKTGNSLLKLDVAINLILRPRPIKLNKFQQDIVDNSEYFIKYLPKKISILSKNYFNKINHEINEDNLEDFIITVIDYFEKMYELLLGVHIGFESFKKNLFNEFNEYVEPLNKILDKTIHDSEDREDPEMIDTFLSGNYY